MKKNFNIGLQKIYGQGALLREKMGRIITGTSKADEGLAADLSSIAESLGSMNSTIEPKFIKLGDELQNVYSEADNLRRRTIETANLISNESEDNIFTIINNLAQTSLIGLQDCQQEISQNLLNVKDIGELIKNLHKKGEQIEKIILSLNITCLNIAVESSRSMESEQMFQSFIQELKQQSKEIVATAQGICNDANTTKIKLDFAHKEISRGQGELHSLTKDAEIDVNNASGGIEEILELSRRSLEQTSIHTKEISRQIGEIVVAIQFHDISRQQIEHIVAGLEEAAALCAEESSESSSSTTREKNLTRANFLVKLQSAQLKDVIEEIENAYKTISTAFQEISIEVGTLISSTKDLNADSIDENTKANPFSALRVSLEHLTSLSEKGRGLQIMTQEEAKQISDTVTLLSQYIEKVRHFGVLLHFQALNAVIKSIHLGDLGLSLEILAQEVSSLSAQSENIVSSTILDLEKIIGLTKDLKGESREKSDQSSELADTAGVTLKTTFENISQTNNRIIETSTSALDEANALQKTISQTGASVIFLQEIADDLRTRLGESEKVLEILKPWDPKKEDSQNEKQEEAFDYTMEREREIYHQIIGKEDRDEGKIDTKNPDINSREHPGGSIDLFDSSEDGADETSSDKNDEEDPGGSIELFDSSEDGADETSSDKNDGGDEEEDLGDNIELF